ncbi:MAG: hypothetical protein M0P61_17325 [Ignavibacteriaceae bacterium]|jgi:hypothetical protein|nr:hypothetical protein [Ignavibacteriaceae bacterium]
MENKTELRDKIYRGIKSAIEKLISSRAKDDGFLIVSKNGKIVKIPAKDLKQN